MGCESSRQDKPNDSIRFNENVLKFRSKSVAAISEAFFNLNRVEDGQSFIEKTRMEKGISIHLGIEYSREDYRLIVNPFLKAFFLRMEEDIENRKLELYDYPKFKTYLYLLATGTTEEKAQAIFRSYDTEAKEELSREELEIIFKDLFETVRRVGEILSELNWVKINEQQEGTASRIQGAISDVINFLLKDGQQKTIAESAFIERSGEYVRITLRDVFNAEGARKVIMPFVFQSAKDKNDL